MLACKKTLILWLLYFFTFQFTFAQSSVSDIQQQLWNSRAEIISNEIATDANKSKPLNKALFLGKLGNIWWQIDKIKAAAFFEKSVDTLSFYLFKEDPQEDKKYFDAVRATIRLIGNRNVKQTNRLIKILSENSEEAEKNSNADALIDLALEIVKQNPQKAFDLAQTAFRIGSPKNFYQITWELRRENPSLADNLSKIILAYAAENRNFQTLNGVNYMTFPELFVPNFPASLSPPNNLKIAYLNFIAQHINEQQIKFSAKTIAACDLEVRLVSPLLTQYATLLPQKTELVQQAVKICSSNQNSGGKQTAKPNPFLSLENKSIDEILSSAAEIEEPNIRAIYFLKAGYMAHRKKDYQKVIEILNKMSDEERQTVKDDWEELFHDSSSLLAFDKYKNSDLIGSMEVLRNVPVNVRPLAQITFILQFQTKDLADRSFTTEILRDARENILRSEKLFAVKFIYWLHLVKLYSNYDLPIEAGNVFRELASAFNKETANDKTNPAIIKTEQVTGIFPVELLSKQDNAVLETINSMSSTESRVNFKLALLELALKQLESLKKPIQTQKQKNSDTKQR
ncbi:MAG TPA: hypothetical protein VF648_11860 [Pyrinomonadaceae bacterium]|jgi:hypothetical protein